MSQLPISLLDLLVIGIVLLSALLASVRGFTREVLAIGSWVIAAVAAYAFHPQVLAFLEPHIANRQIALAAAIAAVFLVTLVIVTMITVKLSDAILDSSIGALDRTLGFLFGAARGFLIAAVAFLFFDKLVGEKQYPDWVRDAKMRPLLKESGDQLIALLPTDAGFLEKLKAKAISGATPAEGQSGQDGQPKTP
ncbi:MAG: CvpA family protein [Alphaproteobacteria bacterium]|jgi:membrane protein required for colicin V production|nr:CvpA family protein [Alphaproteobacteria bacterium]